MKISILTILFLILAAPSLYSQGKFEFNVGVGFFEAISLKARYGEKMQIGLAQGFAGPDLFQSSVEFYYHFKSKSQPDKKTTLYIMAGLGSTFLSRHFTNRLVTTYPRLGFTFRFSKTTGLNLDFGPCLLRYRYTDRHSVVTPSGSIHFFLKV